MTHRRVALFARVSTQDQNCDRQVRDLEEYAQRAGYEVVGVFTETVSGVAQVRSERAKVMKLAQARKIDAVLVTEMTRWGRSLTDLLSTLQDLQGFGVSLIAQTGLTYDLSTPQGKLIAGVMAAVSEFEKDLIRERTLSGLSAARARGKKLGRQPGQLVVQDKIRGKVQKLRAEGLSIRKIASRLDVSTTTIQRVLKVS